VKKILPYLILFFICFCVIAKAQKNDSLRLEFIKDSIHKKRAVNKAIYSTARKATIMSAVFPGLGQIYNRKYWKAPVIYAALGGLGYWGVTNQVKYKYYSDNLRYENDDDESTVNGTLYSTSQLIDQKRYYRKYRDIAIMAGALVYLVNIIDANVDAHLKTFDVSDDLSLQVNPYSNFDYNNKLQAGLTLKLKFK
jgi:hypothetical protein